MSTWKTLNSGILLEFGIFVGLETLVRLCRSKQKNEFCCTWLWFVFAFRVSLFPWLSVASILHFLSIPLSSKFFPTATSFLLLPSLVLVLLLFLTARHCPSPLPSSTYHLSISQEKINQMRYLNHFYARSHIWFSHLRCRLDQVHRSCIKHVYFFSIQKKYQEYSEYQESPEC